MSQELVTCLKCGTVAFRVTREFAEQAVKRFNEYFQTLTPDVQQECYGGIAASMALYEYCWCGNTGEGFREYREGDCPEGVTLSPIIIDQTTRALES